MEKKNQFNEVAAKDQKKSDNLSVKWKFLLVLYIILLIDFPFTQDLTFPRLFIIIIFPTLQNFHNNIIIKIK